MNLMKELPANWLHELNPTIGHQSVAAVRPERSQQMYPALTFILKEVRRDEEYQHLVSEGDTPQRDLIVLIERVADRLGFELAPTERDQLLEVLERERHTFGILQKLVDNLSITDVIVSDYATVAVQQGRRNVLTSVRFPNQQTYEAFVERLLARAGSSYSTKQPVADGMIDSFARIHVVHKSLCETGPYLTIRLNRFDSVSTQQLIEAGLAPTEIFSYLTALVLKGRTLLIVGEVGTGKTTLSRALATSIPADESILVIEDTPEIRLEHPHVRYLRTREENTEGSGRISPSGCIRAGMRMAMNRIIFGEIRDAEAAEAFVDVCASGHPGVSTLHARSAAEAVTRLELLLGRAQPGVGRQVLQEQISTAVQAIVFVSLCPETGSRRINEVREIGAVADGKIRQRTLFQYQVVQGNPTWKAQTKVSLHREDIEDLASLASFPPLLTLHSTSTS
jgi:pilus assembly protein CpaF